MLKSMLTFSTISFIKPALGILLLPLYLNYLSPTDFANLALISIIAMLVGVFANFRLDHSMRTFYFDYQGNPAQQFRYLHSTITISLLFSTLLTALMFFIGEWIFSIAFSANTFSFFPLGFFAIIAVILGQCTLSYFVYLQNERNLKRFVILRVTDITVSVIAQVVLVLVFELGITGVIVGHLIASSITATLVFSLNINAFRYLPDFTLLTPSLKFVTPLVLFSFVTLFESMSDRLILERFLDYADLGIYTIVLSIIGVSALVYNSIDNAIRPYLYVDLKNKYNSYKITQYLTVYTATGLSALLFIACAAANIHWFTDNPQYMAVSTWAPIAALAFACVGITRFYALNYVFFKKSSSLTIWSTVKVGVTFLLLLFLVPKYGILGALCAIGLGNLLNAVLFVIHIRSFTKIKADIVRIGVMFLAFICLTGIIPTFISMNFSGIYTLIAALSYGVLILMLVYNDAKTIITASSARSSNQHAEVLSIPPSESVSRHRLSSTRGDDANACT